VPPLVDAGLVDPQDGFPCEMFDYFSGATNVGTTIDFDAVAGTVQVRFVEQPTTPQGYAFLGVRSCDPHAMRSLVM